LASNEAIHLTLEFSGRGNLGLIGTPDIVWPADLEVFDPEIKDRIRTTVSGQSGKRTLTYLVIPRAKGTYEVALPNLSYFDWEKARHERVSAPPIQLEVEGSAEEGPSFGFNSKSDVTILTRDVRFIRTETELRPRTALLWKSPAPRSLGIPPLGPGRPGHDAHPTEARGSRPGVGKEEEVPESAEGSARGSGPGTGHA
jgi:hypothetical protein